MARLQTACAAVQPAHHPSLLQLTALRRLPACLQGDLLGARRQLSKKLQLARWWLMPGEAAAGLLEAADDAGARDA